MVTATPRDPLLFRFSLYGFLKNQQYYEPFFLLVLRGKGLSFFDIGLLYSFREICVNVMGIPAGFLADMFGRRTSLVVCFAAYIVSFVGFAFSEGRSVLFATMFAFAVGESFRSGTHKAMIFHHLRLTGRESQKATVYGFTRSWSKAGSALSSLLSGLLVLVTGHYERIFLFAIPPYLLNIANVSTYPRALEGEISRKPVAWASVFLTMWHETAACLRSPALRNLFLESAVLQGIAKTVKDYVQPLVVVALADLAVQGPLSKIDATRRSAVLLGILYFGLNSLASAASRHAHRFDTLERQRFPWLWCVVVVAGSLLALGAGKGGTLPGAIVIATIGFALLVFLENVWRPLFLDRLDDVADSRYGAAVLSVEAQFSSLSVMVCAPMVGKAADHWGVFGVGSSVVALALLTGILSYRNKRSLSVRRTETDKGAGPEQSIAG